MEAVTNETPIPLVDLDRLERNLDRMAGYASKHQLALRPHTKTHKSPRIAAEQIRRGAIGLTCATLLEAEVMAEASSDLFLAYQPVGEAKLQRLLALPAECEITVALDSDRVVDELYRAALERDRRIGVLVELDLGMHRVGVAGIESAIRLAAMVAQRPPLIYRGITFYPGHIRGPAEHIDAALQELREVLGRAVAALDEAGLRPGIVSGGSTPTAWRTHEIAEITEIRPGT